MEVFDHSDEFDQYRPRGGPIQTFSGFKTLKIVSDRASSVSSLFLSAVVVFRDGAIRRENVGRGDARPRLLKIRLLFPGWEEGFDGSLSVELRVLRGWIDRAERVWAARLIGGETCLNPMQVVWLDVKECRVVVETFSDSRLLVPFILSSCESTL